MLYRTLGKTGVEVSALGFGCMRFPTLGAPDRIEEDAARRLLYLAIESGVNYIDTAWFYHATAFGQEGHSEPFLGEALSGGWRDKIHLATKLPQQIIKTADQMEWFLSRQLERLRTDRIDFYLVHGLSADGWNKMKDFGVREFLDKAKAEGLIGHCGFSFHGDTEVFPRIIDEYEGWEFAQIQYNYMDVAYQAGYSGLRYAAERGLGVIVMEPLKGGRLARNLQPELRAVFEARSEGWSPAEWALRFALNDPGVSLVLSGMNEESQLEENLRVASTARPGELGAERLEVFEAAKRALATRTKADCTACRYCQPCPFGVQIPESLAALNASAIWNSKDKFLTGYVRIKGTPDLCTECGQCEDICPQSLPIRALLKETAATFAQ